MILQIGQQVRINNGPSKFDLVIAFADRYGPADGIRLRRNQRSVGFQTNFQTGSGDRAGALFAEIRLDSLKHEDGSGHSWIFTGTLTDSCSFGPPKEPAELSGYYNSKNHTGFFGFT